MVNPYEQIILQCRTQIYPAQQRKVGIALRHKSFMLTNDICFNIKNNISWYIDGIMDNICEPIEFYSTIGNFLKNKI